MAANFGQTLYAKMLQLRMTQEQDRVRKAEIESQQRREDQLRFEEQAFRVADFKAQERDREFERLYKLSEMFGKGKEEKPGWVGSDPMMSATFDASRAYQEGRPQTFSPWERADASIYRHGKQKEIDIEAADDITANRERGRLEVRQSEPFLENEGELAFRKAYESVRGRLQMEADGQGITVAELLMRKADQAKTTKEQADLYKQVQLELALQLKTKRKFEQPEIQYPAAQEWVAGLIGANSDKFIQTKIRAGMEQIPEQTLNELRRLAHESQTDDPKTKEDKLRAMQILLQTWEKK